MIYTVSARSKPLGMPIEHFLDSGFPEISKNDIDSVFGFVERSTLYGGREFIAPEMTDKDISDLYSLGIGVRIPLTNHYISEEEYEQNMPLLAKYHKKNNAVIVTNDILAHWIRRDFPQFRIEASVIKGIKTQDKIQDALDIYDTVVLPMYLNTNFDFLKAIENKDRITLFANAGCALTCPSKICYPSISKANKFKGDVFLCSQTMKDRNALGMVDFDLEQLASFGFSRFKVLRSRGVTGF